ncbi:hypothetical protein LMG32289_00849 [Cupriavidus pampae]|uniref:Uncharacterized protein n=1 Tax=Cupriavidus pampae TaxID=659251 RepID=A0ABM8WB51_9BURK|nr:hypothetical protein LMG32289_00849 [Cupriavidus pampae]
MAFQKTCQVEVGIKRLILIDYNDPLRRRIPEKIRVASALSEDAIAIPDPRIEDQYI